MSPPMKTESDNGTSALTTSTHSHVSQHSLLHSLQQELDDVSSESESESENKTLFTMAENVPPGQAQSTNNNNSSSTTAAAAATADQPGRPYYESLRSNLRQILEKKRKLDEQLAAVEDQIFKAEGSYLEETANSGNIVRGFDGWVKGVQVAGRGGADDRRRGRVRDDDRVFSRSSVSWMRSQEGPDSNPTSHAPTPTGSFAPQIGGPGGGGGGNAARSHNKKKRPTEREDEEDGKAQKRGKITYARD